MTENDKKILEVYRKAKNWDDVDGLDLDEKLESEEAKQEVHDILFRLYHNDEYDAEMA